MYYATMPVWITLSVFLILGSEKSESNGRVTDEEDRYVYF